MQSHGIYNLNIEQYANEQRMRRIGLLQEKTGVPVFLIYLQGVDSAQLTTLRSSEDVEMKAHQASSVEDKEAWRLILPFFEGNGSLAHVIASPLSSSPNQYLASFIGKDKGLNARTGIHSLRNLIEYADIVSVPQAAILLSPVNHNKFYRSLLDFAQSIEHFFVLIDFPKNFDIEEIQNCLKDMSYPDAAVFYPWLMKNADASPPSPLVASCFQVSDEQNKIFQLPSNRSIPGNYLPMRRHTPFQIQNCLENRVNCLHYFNGDDLRIWGGSTLAGALDFDSRFISTRRTLMAIRDAIHQVCEPYVFEPASQETTEIIQVTLQSFLQSIEYFFNSTSKQPYTLEVKTDSNTKDNLIKIKATFALPYALDQVSLSMDLRG